MTWNSNVKITLSVLVTAILAIAAFLYNQQNTEIQDLVRKLEESHKVMQTHTLESNDKFWTLQVNIDRNIQKIEVMQEQISKHLERDTILTDKDVRIILREQ